MHCFSRLTVIALTAKVVACRLSK